MISTLQANKLSTVKKCLNEVLKFGGPFNARDLYPVRTPLLRRIGFNYVIELSGLKSFALVLTHPI